MSTATVSPQGARSTPERNPEWWVDPLRWCAVVVWLAIPVFALLAQPYAGRTVWTVAVASIPIFIVLVGYHRWRRICPIAFVNQIPTRLRRPGTRRVPAVVEENYHYIPLTLFVVGLWLRLVATNGDGLAIAVFFVGLSLVALVFGILFTGKTWCQYVCPVSFIEKIYTEPHGLRETQNSQCAKCTACKKACPDISQENGYWKEVDAAGKRRAYFAYPGLVFGFYFYYFLQAGTWDYYFGGSWTDEPGVLATAFLPGADPSTAGFYFLPVVPRALASLLTLVGCAFASYMLFSLVEAIVRWWLRRRPVAAEQHQARHYTFAIAAFVAFVTFYSFAGQPTLRKMPWLPLYVSVLVVGVATLTLARRLRRTQDAFAEEALARNIVKRWDWPDMQPPKSLHDAFLVHQSRLREHARGYEHLLETYQAAVRELIESGFVTRNDAQRLDWLRTRLQIKKSDHERILTALAEEERLLLSDPTRQAYAEKRLQFEAYQRALRRHVGQVLGADSLPDEDLFDQLRAEYGITEEEHTALLDELLSGDQDVALQVGDDVRLVATATRAIELLAGGPSSDTLLTDLLRRWRATLIDRLLRVVGVGDAEAANSLRASLESDEPGRRREALQLLHGRAMPATSERLDEIERALTGDGALPTTEVQALQACLTLGEGYIRAAALQDLADRGAADHDLIQRMQADDHELMREVAEALGRQMRHALDNGDGGSGHAELTTIEKMRYLRTIPLFASLEPDGLAELAHWSAEATFEGGDVLCREGEPGHDVFVLLTGEVEVRRGADGHESVVEVDRPGEVLGEMAVIDPAPRAATVLAGPDGARALRLSGEAFRRVLFSDPIVAVGVIRSLARRLRGGQSEAVELVVLQ